MVAAWLPRGLGLRKNSPRITGNSTKEQKRMSVFRRKPLDNLIAESSDESRGLKKTLTAIDLTALGIGAIIGAGIFATLGAATAGGSGQPPAGPGGAGSILLTAVACGFCALCYAQLPIL